MIGILDLFELIGESSEGTQLAKGGGVGEGKRKEIYWYMPFYAYEFEDGTIQVYYKDQKEQFIKYAKDLKDAKFIIDNLQKGYAKGSDYIATSTLYKQRGMFYIKNGYILEYIGKNEDRAVKIYSLQKEGALKYNKYAKGGTVGKEILDNEFWKDIAHLWRTSHIDIDENGKWFNTGRYKGCVNNTSGLYYKNSDADLVVGLANSYNVELSDIKTNNPKFTAFDFYKKEFETERNKKYAKGGNVVSNSEMEKLSNLAYQLQNADEGWIKNNHGEFVKLQNEYKKQFVKVYGHSNYENPNNFSIGGGINSKAKKFSYTDKNILGRNLTSLVRAAGENGLSKYIERKSDNLGIITVPSNKKEAELLLDIVDFTVGRKNIISFDENESETENKTATVLVISSKNPLSKQIGGAGWQDVYNSPSVSLVKKDDNYYIVFPYSYVSQVDKHVINDDISYIKSNYGIQNVVWKNSEEEKSAMSDFSYAEGGNLE
jgi:hypothetical protein